MHEGSGLRVEDVHKSYEGETQRVDVLQGISFALDPGQSLAVTGPSGSGKSTLLHLIGALDRPSSGRIELDGREPHCLGEAELAHFRNRTIGFVFQDHHLLPQYSVLENVLMPTLAFRDGGGSVERARELLERVALSHRIDHRPAELSGGERQRAAVARALINGPALVLGDEPTGNLDARNARGVAELLLDLQREMGTMLIVVTHSAELAARFARRIELRDGRCGAP